MKTKTFKIEYIETFFDNTEMYDYVKVHNLISDKIALNYNEKEDSYNLISANTTGNFVDVWHLSNNLYNDSLSTKLFSFIKELEEEKSEETESLKVSKSNSEPMPENVLSESFVLKLIELITKK